MSSETRLSDLKISPKEPAGGRPLKVALTGSTGFIGSALKPLLQSEGYSVYPRVRRSPRLESPEIFWNPYLRKLQRDSLEGMDAVVHLAGESIAGGRWTARKKTEILRRRVEGTKFLAETLASLQRPPKVFLVSSAVGFYGNRGDEVLTEESPAGEGFLSGVCRAWEAAAEPARRAGIRTVHVRTGIVLSRKGGALARMLLPFLMGLGGRLGEGSKWMSWIALEDLVRVFHYLLYAESLSGPVNATAPGAVTNADFTKVLGKVIHRPTVIPLPAFAVRLLLGEMGETLLLEGQKVVPAKLLKAGFSFLYPDLEGSLRPAV